MVEGACIHRESFIRKTALLSQKEALRESNFKRYGRRRVYTHRRFDSQNGHFEPKSSFTGIKNSKGMVEGECKHIEGLIPKTAFSSQKAALRESNFKRYGRFRAKKQLYGNQISGGMVEGECIHIEGLVGFSEVFWPLQCLF